MNTSRKSSAVPTHAVVKQMIDSKLMATLEHKIYEVAYSGTTAAAGVVLAITNGITEGDGIAQRTGRTVKLDSLHERITLTSAAVGVNSVVRVITFHDTQNTGAGAPAVVDVLSVATVVAHYEPNYLESGRFKILSDRMHTLTSGGSNNILALQNTFKSTSKVFYGGATAVPASDKKNAVFVLLITNSTVNQPTYVVDVATRFTDA